MEKMYYLSGKMTGLPNDGKAVFHAEAERLRALGLTVWSPAEQQARNNWEEYMREDIAALCACDAVLVLDNWRQSRGARLEVFVAGELGIPVYESASVYRSGQLGGELVMRSI